ncbi:hypothetical protein P4O66_003687 [Electrophorus voltai]|uniref:Uncharacterized protein n=1 Tax=Electrophorus voltai TaxID=2609070 RepID=A0AAD8YR68_9TELE|nr:hypothetical protein P4O66_003687 [Electrophorus voltai]
MRTSFRFSDEESESDDASMAASMDSEGEVAFVHGIDAVLDKGFVSESEAHADEGQPPSKRPLENLFVEKPLVCDAVVNKEGEVFFSDQTPGLLEGIPGILDLAAEMGFSWISLSQPWNGNDLHWLKLMRTSFRFSDEESESDDASMAASMDSEGEVAFVHGIDAVLICRNNQLLPSHNLWTPMRVPAGRLASHKGSRSTSPPQAKKGVSIPSPPTPGNTFHTLVGNNLMPEQGRQDQLQGKEHSQSPRLPGNIGAYYTNQELYWQQVYWEWYMQTYYSHLSSLEQWHMACHQNHLQNIAKEQPTTPPPQLRKRKRKAFSGDEGSFSHSSSESEAHADEGQPPSKRPRKNLFREEPLVCDAVVTKEEKCSSPTKS